MESNNIILTGLPRSGTTLTCHLLNKLPDTVALHEPMRAGKFDKKMGISVLINLIKQFFNGMRYFLIVEGIALTKHIKGKVPDNHVGNIRTQNGLRVGMATTEWIEINKTLSSNFKLIIKHPALFTALLDELVNYFPCYAVVRNPLAILASWNSVAFPVENGHVPVAENLDYQLKEHLNKINDKFERQLFILSWFYDNFKKYLPPENIIKYEDIIKNNGRILNKIIPDAKYLKEPLSNKNKNNLYDKSKMFFLAKKLLKSDGPYWEFYNKNDIEELLK